jgi:NADH dehydrogenase [ubiquinone] 1 alpha subcomplex assembly factor 7
VTPLLRELRAVIAHEGPISVERYMALCLSHPVHGYYATRDPLGAAGDFTTAPEISQMFGELIGLWAASVWDGMGRPDPLRLIELGPGRGTLAADALRAARALPGFLDALDLHLVETSPVLRAKQSKALQGGPVAVSWHEDLGEIPDGAGIVIANEFLDALPIRQYVRTKRGWCERLVGLSEDGLSFGLAGEPERGLNAPAPAGTVLEIPAAGIALMRRLAGRLVASGGAALVVDYGAARDGRGDTLQAVKGHAFADPLGEPGEADLTAHVDFAALAEAARQRGARAYEPVTLGDFLRALGIETRAAALKARATPPQVAAIESGLRRLTGDGSGEMGELFKVMAVTDPTLGPPPGFSPQAQER